MQRIRGVDKSVDTCSSEPKFEANEGDEQKRNFDVKSEKKFIISSFIDCKEKM